MKTFPNQKTCPSGLHPVENESKRNETIALGLWSLFFETLHALDHNRPPVLFGGVSGSSNAPATHEAKILVPAPARRTSCLPPTWGVQLVKNKCHEEPCFCGFSSPGSTIKEQRSFFQQRFLCIGFLIHPKSTCLMLSKPNTSPKTLQ